MGASVAPRRRPGPRRRPIDERDTGQNWPLGLGRMVYHQSGTVELSAIKASGVDEWGFQFVWRNAANTAWHTVATPTASGFKGKWHFVVVKYDPSADTLSLQVDGGTVYTTTGVTDVKATNLNDWDEMYFGYSPVGYVTFTGGLCGFARWSELLSSDDLADLYNGGRGRHWDDLLAATKTNCEFYFELDEETNTTRVDKVASYSLFDDPPLQGLPTPYSVYSGQAPPGESFGPPDLVGILAPSGVAGLEAFGSHTVQVFSTEIRPDGIASGEAFGSARLMAFLHAVAIASGEALGTAALRGILAPPGILTAESFGTALLRGTIVPSGIVTAEAFGAHRVASGIEVYRTEKYSLLELTCP